MGGGPNPAMDCFLSQWKGYGSYDIESKQVSQSKTDVGKDLSKYRRDNFKDRRRHIVFNLKTFNRARV